MVIDNKTKKALAVTVKSLLINLGFYIKRCVVIFCIFCKLLSISLLCSDWTDVKCHVPTVGVFDSVWKLKDFNDCMLNFYWCLLK